MMISVILLSMLMVLLSTLNVIRHLICGNNQNWLLNLNLIYKTVWNGAEINLLISVLEKLSQFLLTGLITFITLVDVHMSWLNWFHFLILNTTHYSDRLHHFSVTIPRCYKDVYVNGFFPCTARLWNSLTIECANQLCTNHK